MNKDDVSKLSSALIPIIIAVFLFSIEINRYINSYVYIITLLLPIVSAAFAAFYSIYLSRKNKGKDRIFISYSAKDRDKAVEIANKIIEFGFKPWIDTNEILPGQNIADEIRKGIDKSSVFIVLLSENYNSNFTSKELELAMHSMRSNDKTFSPILPIVIGDTLNLSIPESLKSTQWLLLRNNEEEGYKKLKEGLQRIIGKDN